VKDLILHPRALGDILLSLPALTLLKKHWPQSQLTLGGNLDFMRVAARGCADRMISLSTLPLHRLYTDSALPNEDVDFWNSFDRVVSWTGSGNTLFERRLSEIHPAARVAPWKPGPGDRRHVSRVFADSLVPWIPKGEALAPPRLSVDEEGLERGQEWLREREQAPARILVALHAGAGSAEKRWATARFKALTHAILKDNRVSLLAIEGPAEPGTATDLARNLPLPRAMPAIGLPLSVLAAVLIRCAAYVGNDSGISHLASALGVPSIVLFGPTDPGHWAPLGDNVRVICRKSGCSACEGAGGSVHTCLDNISVEEVMANLLEMRS
jgi:ADP-heptose:LPS heptosyltransferase